MGNNIPGIHNYCDRWCERCGFTARCAVYEQEQGISDAENDIHNTAFWERLSENFAKAMQMLNEKAKELGIDLDAISEESEKEEKIREKKRLSQREHPLMQLSFHYSDQSMEWRKQSAISEKADQILREYEMGLVSVAEAKQEADSIKECLEVIGWYEHFIPSKLMRALGGKAEDTGWEKENGFQRDYDGSAKVALIGIERSLQAWVKLFEMLPEQEDSLLPILATLEKIRNMSNAEFPEAHLFKRPGFDEMG